MTQATTATATSELKLVPEIRRAIEDRLNERRRATLKAIEELSGRKNLDCCGDAVDRVDASYFRQEVNGQEDRERAVLARIDFALRLLEENKYGLCIECTKPIPLERLQAIPETVLCIDCQKKQERSFRRH